MLCLAACGMRALVIHVPLHTSRLSELCWCLVTWGMCVMLVVVVTLPMQLRLCLASAKNADPAAVVTDRRCVRLKACAHVVCCVCVCLHIADVWYISLFYNIQAVRELSSKPCVRRPRMQ